MLVSMGFDVAYPVNLPPRTTHKIQGLLFAVSMVIFQCQDTLVQVLGQVLT